MRTGTGAGIKKVSAEDMLMTVTINSTTRYLFCRKYKTAAKQFLEANLDYCDCPDLMSPHNVAVYGGLAALATFDRTELFKLVISSSQFKVSFDKYRYNNNNLIISIS
jgi:COP9 signalosome complex subunit 1